jgi:hypothetical protein
VSLSSLVAAYFYLRIAGIMFLEEPATDLGRTGCDVTESRACRCCPPDCRPPSPSPVRSCSSSVCSRSSCSSSPVTPACCCDERPATGTARVPAPVLAELDANTGLAVSATLEAVEARLTEQVASSQAFVDRAARYLIDAGGKRFRPLLVALTGHLG